MKVRLKQTYFDIILLFPIATLFQNMLGPINKILFGFLSIILITLIVKKLDRRQLFLFLLTILVYIITIFNTSGVAYNTNEYFYFPFSVAYLIYMTDNLKDLKICILNNQKKIRITLEIWTAIVLISAFFPSSYSSTWGSGRYFGSFCQSIFRLGPTCLFIISLSICAMIFFDNRKYFYYSFVPLIAIMMGGSRTYMLVGICAFVLGWYYYVDNKIKFLLSLLPMAIFLFLIIINSSMLDKFKATSYTSDSYFDFWGTITSGRSIFWAADMRYFFDTSILKKIFGSGFNQVYEINQKAFAGKVWAHNDFIQCLISHGLMGLFLYLISIKKAFQKIRRYGTDFIPYLCLFFLWFFNAFFNMFYTYFCSILCFPLYMLVVIYGKKRFEF